MKRLAILALAAILPGCGGTVVAATSVDAMIDADFTTGALVLTCRASSSGACHAVLLTDGQRDDLKADIGGTANATGLGDRTTYCVGAAAPDPATCKPRPLADGQQIIRISSAETKS